MNRHGTPNGVRAFRAYEVYKHNTPHGVLDLRLNGERSSGGGAPTQHIFERTGPQTIRPSVLRFFTTRRRQRQFHLIHVLLSRKFDYVTLNSGIFASTLRENLINFRTILVKATRPNRVGSTCKSHFFTPEEWHVYSTAHPKGFSLR